MTTIVFDLDDTLCSRIEGPDEIEKTTRNNPECILINWHHQGRIYPHLFIPYIGNLIEYLLQAGARIVFFSSGIKERNEFVVAELLKQILGEKTYWKLKSEGQFEIFSKHHMRKAQGMETGNYTKDLTPIIKPPESPENLILVDDDSSYIADGQKPYIPPIDLQHCDYSNNSFDYDTFPKNAAYYLIGLFKSYFKNPKYNNLPIREAFQIILPDRDSPEMRDLSKSGFVHEIICEGLSEVRKTFGEAIFYGFQIWKMALIPEIAIDSKYDSDESGDDTLIIPDPDDQDGSKLRHSRYIKPKITNPMLGDQEIGDILNRLSETPDNSPTIRAFLEHLFLREAIIPVPEELRIKAERILAEYQKAMGEMQDLHEFIFS